MIELTLKIENPLSCITYHSLHPLLDKCMTAFTTEGGEKNKE